MVLAAAGCGSADPPPPGAAAVQLTVTRNFGNEHLVSARAAPGQSAMFALRRNADVGGAYAGKFVASINGVKGNTGNGWDWFYFVNGIQANVGAAAYTLHKGDREWWDYRYWTVYQEVPVVIGAWPDPFVHGWEGAQPSVHVGGLGCAQTLASALKRDGAQLTNGQADATVTVMTFAQAANGPISGAQAQSRGLTVWLEHGGVMIYRNNTATADPSAQALIAAYRPDGAGQNSATLVVAGRTEAAACAAARTLADRPAAVRSAYAVALDGDGRVTARGGAS